MRLFACLCTFVKPTLCTGGNVSASCLLLCVFLCVHVCEIDYMYWWECRPRGVWFYVFVCVFVHVCEIDSVTLCTGGKASASCLFLWVCLRVCARL